MAASTKRQGPSPWALTSAALHALTLTAVVFALAGRGGSPSLPAGQTAPHNHAGRRLLEDGSARKLLGASPDDVDVTRCISIVTESSGSGSNQEFKRYLKFSCPIVVKTARGAECSAASVHPYSPCADTEKPAVSIVQGAQVVAAPLLSATPANSGNAAAFNGPISVDLSKYSTQNGWLDAIWIVQAAPNAVKNANPPIPNHAIHIKGNGGAGDNNAAFYVDGTTWMTGANADKDTAVLNVQVKSSQSAVDARGPVSIDLSKYNTTNGWLDALWIVQAPPNAVKNANPPIGNHGIHIQGNGGANDNNGALYVAGNTYLMGTYANNDSPALFVQADRNQNGVKIAGRINPKVNALHVSQGFINLQGGKTTVGELEAAAVTTKVLTVTDRCNARSYYRGWPNSKPWN